MVFQEDEDIKHLELTDTVIRNIQLSNINIDHCIFKNVQFIDCTFTDIIISHSEFVNCLFVNLNIESILNTKFIHCKIQGLTTNELSIIKDSQFLGCSMSFSSIGDCNIKGTLFDDCNLDDSKFYRCKLIKTEIKLCSMERFENYCTSLNNINLSTCNLVDAKFKIDDLNGASCSIEQVVAIAKMLGIRVVD